MIPRATLGAALAASCLALGLDQAAKWAVLGPLGLGEGHHVVTLLPVLNLVFVRNYGVSFGLFAHDAVWTSWVLIAVALAVIAYLLTWLRGMEKLYPATGIGMVTGGALGNVLDRLIHGWVVDFIDVHIGGWHWPAFNLADAAITLGAAILVLDALLDMRRKRQAGHQAEEGKANAN